MRRLIAGLTLIIALEALFSVPFLAFGTVLGLVGMAGTAVLIWLGRERLRKLLAAAAAQLERLPRGVWIGLVLLLGLALRLLWVNLFAGPQPPESQTLTDLAAQLARGEAYRTPLTQTWAEWPPGYPLLLAVTFLITGANTGGIVLLNLVLFAGTVMSTDALARRLAGEGPARLAALLLAVWPSLVAATGIASRELLVLFLLTTALTVWLDAGVATKPGIAAGSWLAAGFALGLATLTEPAFLLLPAVLILHDLLAAARPLRALAAWSLLLFGTLAPIAPWIVRNDRIFHRHPILTTGGGAFYRANNPLATGGPTERGEKELVNLTELETMDTGYRWGAEWITANPGRFLKLAVRKQVLLLGGDLDLAVPIGLKALANAWWWLLWLLILLTLVTWSRPAPLPPGALLLLLTILYVWLIYSVFESGARQHLPLAGVLAVVVALGARQPPRAELVEFLPVEVL